MLVPASLKSTILQVVDVTDIWACILLTSTSCLIAYVLAPPNAEDLVKVLLGLSAEAWHEVQSEFSTADNNGDEQGEQLAMVECEVGRVMVLPINPPTESSPSLSSSFSNMDVLTPKARVPSGPLVIPLFVQWENDLERDKEGSNVPTDKPPKPVTMFLLVLNAPEEIPWGFMHTKGRPLVSFLSPLLVEIGQRLEFSSSASPGGR
ncbi:hypothetical protein BS47DRAFT_1396106 [Hydnum rufescens UP504]|uniref:Uncharacterized protein n=1 Tax=Hydnum rufescens UP504 TaxID=1448309 RepID=A0A9P6DPP3_9AGAM|nr:hypothetical protein BS47DRAFT_1396106 [Hydnum rufescens UP504]